MTYQWKPYADLVVRKAVIYTMDKTVKDIQKMNDTTAQIETFEGVESVQSPTEFADILISFRRIFVIVAIAIVIALVLVSLIIISILSIDRFYLT